MTDIVQIEGIGDAYSVKLREVGIASTETLLDRGSTPKGREELATTTGISPSLILRWVNHADLFRIKGVAGQYSELLEAAGVDTIAELANRNGANLHQALLDTNSAKNLVRQPPTADQVATWIQEAKALPRAVSY